MVKNKAKRFHEAINLALHESLEENPNLLCYGLGIADPKGIFGTTIGLQEKFGSERVFDTPTSENAMTGIGIGAAISGYPVVMTHQRLDFFLLALDQLVNSAAKWHYMFGSQVSVPITIRLIIGRGWGQGPTHCQNLHSWFAHIPGLKVVMPTFKDDAYFLLKQSIKDPNPTVFLEHRWLHNTSWCPDCCLPIKVGDPRLCKEGTDITIVSMSYLTLEALEAANYLSERLGIECEVFDVARIKPMNTEVLEESIRKTGRLLVLDTGHEICSLAGELIATMSIKAFDSFKVSPSRMALRDCPEPTSYGLTRYIYTRATDIIAEVLRLNGREADESNMKIESLDPHDIPGKWFDGPF